LHAALDDRVLDADEFGKSRFDHFWFLRRGPRMFLSNVEGQDAVPSGKSLPDRAGLKATPSCKSGAFVSAGRTFP